MMLMMTIMHLGSPECPEQTFRPPGSSSEVIRHGGKDDKCKYEAVKTMHVDGGDSDDDNNEAADFKTSVNVNYTRLVIYYNDNRPISQS